MRPFLCFLFTTVQNCAWFSFWFLWFEETDLLLRAVCSIGPKAMVFQSAKIKCLLSPCICMLYIFCKLHKHRMQLYLHVYFCHNMTHDMTMSYKLSVFASFTDSQCYVLLSALEARMTRRTALITPPPPPDHGKSPGWHMTRAWFGKKTALVWPWGEELKIYLHIGTKGNV